MPGNMKLAQRQIWNDYFRYLHYALCSPNLNPKHLTGFLRKKKWWNRHEPATLVTGFAQRELHERLKMLHFSLVLNQARGFAKASVFPLKRFTAL